MQGLLELAALGVAWLVLSVAGRPLIALLAGKSVGAQAQQPDSIHLVRAADSAWRDGDTARRVAQAFVAEGFQDAGSYRIEEMPGVVLRLLASPAESMLATIFEHPQAGSWADVSTRYAKGDTFTVSSLAHTGLDDRPGHPIVHLTGASPERVIAAARDRRPRAPMHPADAATAARVFEQAYAAAMAWRKEHGISRREVVKTSMRKAA